jgi:hypothetical protein
VLSYRLALARAAGLEPSWLIAGRAQADDRVATPEDWERAIERALVAAGPEILAAWHDDERAILQAYADTPGEDLP